MMLMKKNLKCSNETDIYITFLSHYIGYVAKTTCNQDLCYWVRKACDEYDILQIVFSKLGTTNIKIIRNRR